MEAEQLLLSIFAIVIAIIAVIVALYNAWQTRKAIVAQIIIELREKYADEKMLEGMHKIQEWKNTMGENYEKTFKEQRKTKGTMAMQVDIGRRNFFHYLRMIYDLKKARTVDKKFVKLMVSKDTVDFLRDHVEPLQKFLPYYDQEEEVYAFFYQLYDS